MELQFFFMMLILSAGFCFILFRLYQLRSVASLAMAAGQVAAFAFMAYSYESGAFLDPFVMVFFLAIGFFSPLAFICLDLMALRKKIRDRFGISLSDFVYRDDRAETQKNAEKAKYADQILRPRLGALPAGNIMAEIRVERADTSKNIQKQLAIAAKKYDEGDLAGAYAAYQIIEKVFNRSPSLYFNIGNIDYDRRDFEHAAQNYRRGVECAGRKDFENDDMSAVLSMLYYNLGNACFVAKKYARAIDAFKNAAENDPSNADALYNLSFCHAMDFEETGDTEKAVEAFKKLAADMPDNLHAWYHYGKCLFKMKNTMQAIECFRKVVDEDDGFYEAWFSLGVAYDECGMISDSVNAYYNSIQMKPDFIDAYNNLGVLLTTAGRNGEALKVLKSAIRIKPGDTELIYNIGMIHYEAGRYDDALGEFLTCAKLRPDDGDLLYVISLAYMRAGKPQESLAYLGKAVAADPGAGARAAKERLFEKYAGRDEYAKLFTF